MTTTAQERLLRNLFGANKEAREKALLSVIAHDRDAVRELIAVRRDAETLLAILMSDLGHASGQLAKNYSNQFWRRTSIRALAAAVDGIIFSLKRLAFVDAKLTKYTLDEPDEFLLTELQTPKAAKKPRFPGFTDNFKDTFRLFAKVHKTTCATDFGQQGFEDLCKTYDLRNRVMHPKTSAAFSIQDAETKRAGAALSWLHTELNRVLSDSMKAVHPPKQ